MALYGMYGSHTPETCPIYEADNARVFVSISDADPARLAEEYGIRRIEARYHSAFEHTFLWIVDADEPHLLERFCIDYGLASFNMLKIVPLHTFGDTVLRLKEAHSL